MGTYLGSAVFSATLFFYFLGLIFVIVGYVGAWLEPKDGYGNEIELISVRMACFNDYEFPSKVGKIEYDSSGKLNRCVDTTKTSRTFKDVSDRRYVSPGKRLLEMMNQIKEKLLLCVYCKFATNQLFD